MCRDHDQRVKQLFLDAIAVAAGERAAHLRAAGASPPELSEVLSLLGVADDLAHTRSSLSGPPFTVVSPVGETDSPPESIGPYRILDELGRGASGVVYLAQDPHLNRQVAIKALRLDWTSIAPGSARFEREAELLARLVHPHITTIHDRAEFDGRQCLVMEHVSGPTLAERVASAPPGIDAALEIGLQVARALAYAHRKGVVHRDLKPLNIRLTEDGSVKILDFGLARLLAAPESVPEGAGGSPSGAAADPAAPLEAGPTDRTATSLVMGTPGYMSPEQIARAPVDDRADIWAFGCILYECLTGSPAFAGATLEARLSATCFDEPDLAPLPEETPARARALVTACLAKAPGDRPETMVIAVRELEAAIRERGLADLGATAAGGVANRGVGRRGELIGRGMQVGLIGLGLVLLALIVGDRTGVLPDLPRVREFAVRAAGGQLPRIGSVEAESTPIRQDGSSVSTVTALGAAGGPTLLRTTIAGRVEDSQWELADCVGDTRKELVVAVSGTQHDADCGLLILYAPTGQEL